MPNYLRTPSNFQVSVWGLLKGAVAAPDTFLPPSLRLSVLLGNFALLIGDFVVSQRFPCENGVSPATASGWIPVASSVGKYEGLASGSDRVDAHAPSADVAIRPAERRSAPSTRDPRWSYRDRNQRFSEMGATDQQSSHQLYPLSRNW